jgi:hypothetical protein
LENEIRKMGFGKTRFRKRDSEAAKTGFGKRDSENGTRKNGIRNRQKLDSENGIRKTGFKKWDSKNSRSPSSVTRRSAFKPIGLGPAKMGSSLSLLCNCNSRASSPSTGSIAIHVVSIFMCTT